MDEFIADREGRKGLITEFAVVQYDDDDIIIIIVINMYCCNITSNIHKTDTITFLHPCERLVVQKVVNLQGIRTLFI